MTSSFWQFFNKVAHIWTDLVPGACGLPFTAAARGLAPLTATPDGWIFFILRARRERVELHTEKIILKLLHAKLLECGDGRARNSELIFRTGVDLSHHIGHARKVENGPHRRTGDETATF